ncbi:MAG TPA: hypothetical protein VHA52_04515 [Candidatus Babeliaceae bacterium]|nr:hypothetical protein [Candidatus Babeliaceae bacterium]
MNAILDLCIKTLAVQKVTTELLFENLFEEDKLEAIQLSLNVRVQSEAQKLTDEIYVQWGHLDLKDLGGI